MRLVKDEATKAIFDDYVFQNQTENFDTDAWTQVCEECAKKFGLLDTYLETDAGMGICGVLGCNSEADHYYDFLIDPLRGEYIKQ